MLSVTSEYALRALTQLARVPYGNSLLGRDLAAKANIPANYLSKILLSLRNAGLVATARGSNGGYWLLRPPDAIHLLDVVQLFDSGVRQGACLLGSGHCSNHAATTCSAHEYWERVKLVWSDFLEKTTLADIAHEKPVAKRGSKTTKPRARAATARG
jgi:Rrf2 family protein